MNTLFLPSARQRRGVPARCRRTATLVTLLVALASAGLAVTAQAQTKAATTDTLPDDDLLDSAAAEQLAGHAWQAEALLRRLAEAGHVTAMERLALLHWYGPRLHPGEPWSQSTARFWFACAAAQGSHLARHMLRVTGPAPTASAGADHQREVP